MTSQIIALGGGGFSGENTPFLDLYILAASDKKTPRVCFLPTASADNADLTNYFKQVFSRYPCKTTHLNIFNPHIKNMEDILLNSDIIYVGGGNTKSMLGLWREWGIDTILKKAYKQGIILSGVSAGLVCWFDVCVTDSIPKSYTTMQCLGLIKGSGCAHYGGSNKRRPTFRKLIRQGNIPGGYGVEDGAGLHFVDGKLFRSISSLASAKAYSIYNNPKNQELIEQEIPTSFLGSKENYNSLIVEPLQSKLN